LSCSATAPFIPTVWVAATSPVTIPREKSTKTPPDVITGSNSELYNVENDFTEFSFCFSQALGSVQLAYIESRKLWSVHCAAVSMHLRNSPANSTTVPHDFNANPSVLSWISASEEASLASAICAVRHIPRNSSALILLSSSRVRAPSPTVSSQNRSSG